MKTAAVIPCRNEAKHIKAVVEEAIKHVNVVIVSDGNSTDGTREIAFKAGAEIIGTPVKSTFGYGVQLRRGLQYARKKYSPDAIVILDGDGQHDPKDIQKMLSPIVADKADVVMGSRDGTMPSYRRFGNRVLTFICNFGCSFKPRDALTGYWAIKPKKAPKLTEDKWGLAVELLVKSRTNGCRMAIVPVNTIYHENYSDNSTTSPIELGLKLLFMIIKWRIKCEVLKK